MGRKIVSGFIVLVFLLTFIAPVCAASKPTITASSASGKPGDDVTVTVSMNGNPGIVSMTLDISYDQKILELTKVSDNNLMPGQMHTSVYKTPYRLTWENDTVMQNILVNGELATLTFHIKDNAVTGDTAIRISVPRDGVYDVDGENVAFQLASGKITVKSVEEERPNEKNEKQNGSEMTSDTETSAPVTRMPFEDITRSDWSYRDIAFVYENGLMTGTAQNRFSPSLTTTRGMIVAIIYRLEKSPTISKRNIYGDVKSGSYYEKAITWASENDIVNGYGGGRFGPDEPITREQLAAILYRYARYKNLNVRADGVSDLQNFSDAGMVSAYAYPAMQWICGVGILKGSGNRLQPNQSATREQVAAILHRFCAEFLE